MKIIIDIPKDVIESAKSSPNYYPTYHFEKIWKAIANGTPLPKAGHWIYKQYDGYPECGNWHCSECDEIDNRTSAYCPNCGAKMVEPQESEEQE